MIPALGKYAGVVLASYGVAILLIGGLVVLTLWRGAAVRAALRVVEERAGRMDG